MTIASLIQLDVGTAGFHPGPALLGLGGCSCITNLMCGIWKINGWYKKYSKKTYQYLGGKLQIKNKVGHKECDGTMLLYM